MREPQERLSSSRGSIASTLRTRVVAAVNRNASDVSATVADLQHPELRIHVVGRKWNVHRSPSNRSGSDEAQAGAKQRQHHKAGADGSYLPSLETFKKKMSFDLDKPLAKAPDLNR